MVEHAVLQGKDAIPFLEKLVVGDLQNLADGTGSLSVMLNERGGIIDDTVITKVSPTEIYMVLNAGCADKDLTHINSHLAQHSGDVQLTVHDDRSLLALQGPKAASVLQPLVETDLSKVYFSHFRQGLAIAGVKDCFLTRTGCATQCSFLMHSATYLLTLPVQRLMCSPRCTLCVIRYHLQWSILLV
jgi:aminomethyltransferase